MNIKKARQRAANTASKAGSYDALDELSRLNIPPAFGELVKSLRLSDDISQTKLATKLGISKQHLSQIEGGKKTVSVARAARFAEALGYPPEQFVIAAIEDELRDAGVDLHIDLKRAMGA